MGALPRPVEYLWATGKEQLRLEKIGIYAIVKVNRRYTVYRQLFVE